MWHQVGFDGSVHAQNWPSYEESALEVDEVEIAVQVNGKVRDKLTIPVSIDNKVLEDQALSLDRVKEFTDGKSIVKVIIIPGKLVNIVVK